MKQAPDGSETSSRDMKTMASERPGLAGALACPLSTPVWVPMQLVTQEHQGLIGEACHLQSTGQRGGLTEQIPDNNSPSPAQHQIKTMTPYSCLCTGLAVEPREGTPPTTLAWLQWGGHRHLQRLWLQQLGPNFSKRQHTAGNEW